MPFTPFHFGLGLAAKAVAPRCFSLVLFVSLQVVIDLESLYNLVRDRDPVHRFLHTFIGATLLAVVSALIGLPVATRLRPPLGRTPARRFSLLLAMALFATWSHVVLDGIMHRDIRPFRPFTDRNPLRGVIGLGALHGGLILLGLIGLIVIAFRRPSSEDTRR